MLELSIQGLSKTYKNGVQALKNITLNIPVGLFGLLGPNGAGKSTLMRTIATLQEPDEGSIHLDGLDVLKQKDDVRRVLGYLPQEFGVYPKVTALEMLNHFAVLKGVTDKKQRKEMVEYLLNQTDLYRYRYKKLSEYSGGMKQRFGVAQALIGNPKLVIVDEPTAGLDPEGRNHFLNLLSEIGENIVVILSTHIVDDVSKLCSRMAVISRGELLLTDEPRKAIDNISGKIWKKTIPKPELETCQQMYNVISTSLVAGNLVVHVFCEDKPDDSFIKVEPDLEDVFFSSMN